MIIFYKFKNCHDNFLKRNRYLFLFLFFFLGNLEICNRYFMIWMAVTKKISTPQIWQMCLYICIGANSQSFANTGALVTCVKNFPESRGVVLGLLKGFLGLSGAIITQLYYAIYGNNSKSLILFIGWLPAAISFAFLRTIRIMKVIRQPNELKVFYDFLYISLGFAGFLMIIIIVEELTQFSKAGYVGSSIPVFVFLFLPLAIVIREEYGIWKRKKVHEVNKSPSQLKIVTESEKPNAGVVALLPSSSINGVATTELGIAKYSSLISSTLIFFSMVNYRNDASSFNRVSVSSPLYQLRRFLVTYLLGPINNRCFQAYEKVHSEWQF